MCHDKIIDCIMKGHAAYWDLLGGMRGNTMHKGDVCWLSGDIHFSYAMKLHGPDYRTQLDHVVERIRHREIPGNIPVSPDSADDGADLTEYVDKTGLFKASFTSLGMAKTLDAGVSHPKADKRLNLYRVNHMGDLKMCGAILNAAFAYDLFSFEHYLDAFNAREVAFHLAECNGLPVGACMSILQEDILDIAWVGTLSGYRKKGIAGCLIQAAEGDAMRKGAAIAVLTASEGAIHAYQRIGYQGYCRFVNYDFIDRPE